MITLKDHLFRNVVGISALLIASVAAFFSIVGMGMLFSGATVSVMVMAASLELGKVVATSFLYRYWTKTTGIFRTYLMIAVLTLMFITSLGTFGWLSNAYQSSARAHEHTLRQTVALEERKQLIESEKSLTKTRIDSLMKIRSEQENRFNDLMNNSVISKSPTQLRQLQEQNTSMVKQSDLDMATERGRYSKLNDELFEAEKQILDSKNTSDQSKDVLTFQFVADSIGWDLTRTVKWFIILIIAVFDPLAISLLIGYNIILADEKTESQKKSTQQILSVEDPIIKMDITPPTPTPTPTISTHSEIKSAPKRVQEPVLRENEKYHTPSR